MANLAAIACYHVVSRLMKSSNDRKGFFRPASVSSFIPRPRDGNDAANGGTQWDGKLDLKSTAVLMPLPRGGMSVEIPKALTDAAAKMTFGTS